MLGNTILQIATKMLTKDITMARPTLVCLRRDILFGHFHHVGPLTNVALAN